MAQSPWASMPTKQDELIESQDVLKRLQASEYVAKPLTPEQEHIKATDHGGGMHHQNRGIETHRTGGHDVNEHAFTGAPRNATNNGWKVADIRDRDSDIFAEVYSGSNYDPVNGETDPDHKFIYRKDNHRRLGLVGIDYQIVQVDSVLTGFENALEKSFDSHQLQGAKIRDLTAKEGAFVRREVILPNVVCKISERPRGSYASSTDVCFRASLATSHDGSKGVEQCGSTHDGFCANSLQYTHMERLYKRHTSGFMFPQEESEMFFQSAVERWQETTALMQAWAEYKLTTDDAKKMLDAIPSIGQRTKDKLEAQYHEETIRRGQTVWALVSALTYYASHNDKDKGFTVSQKKGRDTEAQTLNRRENMVGAFIFNRLAKQFPVSL